MARVLCALAVIASSSFKTAAVDTQCLQQQRSASRGFLDISPCLEEAGPVALVFSSVARIREIAVKNTGVLNYAMNNLSSLVPTPDGFQRYTIGIRSSSPSHRFLLQGGVKAENLENLTLQLDGTLDFGACMPSNSARCKLKMVDYPGFSYNVSEARTVSMITFSGMRDFRITSASRGRIMGGGEQWYGLIKVLRLGDKRGKTKPRMLDMTDPPSDGLEISHISFEQAAYWTTYLKASNVHIHHSNVTARKILPELPGPLSNPTAWLEELYRINAWNTDGFDVIGDNVHIHDCHIEVSDDCIAVKGGSNWVVERIFASGAGMTLGSEGTAHNITFRDIEMDQTIHGLYVKDHGASDVLYENILIKEVFLFGIWVGPPWQELSGGCSLLFPFVPTVAAAAVKKLTHQDVDSLCYPPEGRNVSNLIFKNVAILKSHTVPVVLFGGRPSIDVTFENLTLGEVPSGSFPFSSKPECYNATVRPASLTAPGQLFDQCSPLADVCTESGPREPLKPCCDESKYDPNGKLPSEWWGVCNGSVAGNAVYV